MERTLEQEVNLSRRACWKHFGSDDDRKTLKIEFTKLESYSHVCSSHMWLHFLIKKLKVLFLLILSQTEKL
jgi:hypothetical protein